MTRSQWQWLDHIARREHNKSASGWIIHKQDDHVSDVIAGDLTKKWWTKCWECYGQYGCISQVKQYGSEPTINERIRRFWGFRNWLHTGRGYDTHCFHLPIRSNLTVLSFSLRDSDNCCSISLCLCLANLSGLSFEMLDPVPIFMKRINHKFKIWLLPSISQSLILSLAIAWEQNEAPLRIAGSYA